MVSAPDPAMQSGWTAESALALRIASRNEHWPLLVSSSALVVTVMVAACATVGSSTTRSATSAHRPGASRRRSPTTIHLNGQDTRRTVREHPRPRPLAQDTGPSDAGQPTEADDAAMPRPAGRGIAISRPFSASLVGMLLVVDLGGVATLVLFHRRVVDFDVAASLDLRRWGLLEIAHGLCSSAKIVTPGIGRTRATASQFSPTSRAVALADPTRRVPLTCDQ